MIRSLLRSEMIVLTRFSILKINGVKEYLDEDKETSDDKGVEVDPYDDPSPALLLGHGRPVSKEEMLVDVPPRSIADRLVSRFLKTSEPARGRSLSRKTTGTEY